MSKLRQFHRTAHPRADGGGYRWRAASGDGELPPSAAVAPARAGRRIASFTLAAVALLAATILGTLPASASGIFVRSANPANEADLVTEGANHTLQYYWATPGGSWSHFRVAGAGTTYPG